MSDSYFEEVLDAEKESYAQGCEDTEKKLKARDAKVKELLLIHKIDVLELVQEPWRNAFINWYVKKWEQGLLPKFKLDYQNAFTKYKFLWIIQEALLLLGGELEK